MNKITLIAFCCLAAIRIEAADRMVRLFPEPGSKVSVSGDNNLHNWVIRGSEIGGWVEIEPVVLDRSDETLPRGRATVRCEVTIPVRSLTTHGEALTEWMHDLLKEKAYPEITFSFRETPLQPLGVERETVYRVDAKGPLAIAGVTNLLAIPIDVVSLGQQRFRLTGKAGLKMSNHSMNPPVLKTSSGDVKYRDAVEVSFEWIVGPKRKGAGVE